MSLGREVNRVLERLGFRLVRCSVHDRWKHRRFLRREFSTSRLDQHFHLPTFAVTAEDLALTERVIRAFSLARETEETRGDSDGPGGDLWEKIGSDCHAGFTELLRRRDVAGAAAVLVNALPHRVAYGLCWDSTMIAYPYVVEVGDRVLLFHNGNGFGASGFGYAVLENA